VQRCWASLWTARAIEYRARQGVASDDVSLAVVVQELVPADDAGVACTVNPLTGDRDQLMINAAWGLGESIVSGQVTPDTVLAAKDGTILDQTVADKELMTVRTDDGTREEPVPADRREQPVLDTSAVAELAEIARGIEELYSQPMDIEWARHDGRFFIVQARPVTGLVKDFPAPEGKWVRGSVMELLPEPVSPLFETMGIPAWSKATVAFYRGIRLPNFDSPLMCCDTGCCLLPRRR
jgi:pyruvate,water dikinase